MKGASLFQSATRGLLCISSPTSNPHRTLFSTARSGSIRASHLRHFASSSASLSSSIVAGAVRSTCGWRTIGVGRTTSRAAGACRRDSLDAVVGTCTCTCTSGCGCGWGCLTTSRATARGGVAVRGSGARLFKSTARESEGELVARCGVLTRFSALARRCSSRSFALRPSDMADF